MGIFAFKFHGCFWPNKNSAHQNLEPRKISTYTVFCGSYIYQKLHTVFFLCCLGWRRTSGSKEPSGGTSPLSSTSETTCCSQLYHQRSVSVGAWGFEMVSMSNPISLYCLIWVVSKCVSLCCPLFLPLLFPLFLTVSLPLLLFKCWSVTVGAQSAVRRSSSTSNWLVVTEVSCGWPSSSCQG